MELLPGKPHANAPATLQRDTKAIYRAPHLVKDRPNESKTSTGVDGPEEARKKADTHYRERADRVAEGGDSVTNG